MENQSMTLNEQALSALKESAKWTYFLSILGFIGIGLMVVASLFISTIFSSLPAFSGNNQMGFDPSNFGSLLTVFYLIIALIYFFPVYYLFKYSKGVKEAIQTKSSEVMADALVNLKSHYKFIGILVLMVLSLYTLIFVLTMFVWIIK